MERATGAEVYGCGSPQSTDITLNIQTTTGGNFSVSLNGKLTVEHLKKLVSKKLKVSKDRICLLHRDRQLMDGTLEENGLLDGSRVILTPSVETGLLSQRPENSVMQALESLNDNQVNDFLSGKSPLNLTMRLGDHMMLIQLQLSTLNSMTPARNLRTSSPMKTSAASITSTNKVDVGEVASTSGSVSPLQTTTETVNKAGASLLHRETFRIKKEDLEMLCNDFYCSITDNKNNEEEIKSDVMDTSNESITVISPSFENQQSPIKSLSNLVSSPLHTSTAEKQNAVANAVKSSLMDMLSGKIDSQKCAISTASPVKSDKMTLAASPGSPSDSETSTDQSSFLTESTIDEYPMESLFNSAVDKGLFENQDDSIMDREISNLATTSHGTNQDTTSGSLPSFQSMSEPLKNKRFQYLLHKTSKFKHPIGQNKQKVFMQSVVNKHKKRMQSRHDNVECRLSSSRTEPYSPRKLLLQPSCSIAEDAQPSTSRQSESFKTIDSVKSKPQANSPDPPVPDTKALIEASKNLTQTLKKLSKEVLTNKIDLRNTEEPARAKVGPGAVIESMKHHGKGIYSGTFSGTLNPALQDRYGRPKRDISTIIHILNDLLCATPPITISPKDSKHSCSVNSSTDDKTKHSSSCSQSSCSYGKCDGHLPSTSTSMSAEPTCACRGNTRSCKSRFSHVNSDNCSSCSVKTVVGDSCKKCDTANTLALENSKTKCKLEQLRLVMQQKKQRREARRLKTMPYTTSAPSKVLGTPDQSTSMQEEIETLA